MARTNAAANARNRARSVLMGSLVSFLCWCIVMPSYINNTPYVLVLEVAALPVAAILFVIDCRMENRTNAVETTATTNEAEAADSRATAREEKTSAASDSTRATAREVRTSSEAANATSATTNKEEKVTRK